MDQTLVKSLGIGADVIEIRAAIRANPAVLSLTDDDTGWTLLHLAVIFGKEQVVELLLANRADPLAEDKWGKTPLQYGIENSHLGDGYREVADLLLNRVTRTEPVALTVNLTTHPTADDLATPRAFRVMGIYLKELPELINGVFHIFDLVLIRIALFALAAFGAFKLLSKM